MSERFVLTTARLKLRPLDEDDVPELRRIMSDPDVVKGLVGDISTPERLDRNARAWIAEPEFWQANEFGNWAVVDRGNVSGHPGLILGVAGAGEPPPEMGEGPECFYFLAQSTWGKGVATEAMEAIIDYLFRRLEVPAVEALIFAELNPGSMRVAEKLGMRPLARLPLLGHHLSEARALETIEFELWRLREANQGHAEAVVAHASFRVGQLISEGVSDVEISRKSLVDSAIWGGLDDAIGIERLEELINRNFTQGQNATGCRHYRLDRETWLA